MNEAKLKKCKVCKSQFRPFLSTDKYCSWACARESGALTSSMGGAVDYRLKDWAKKVKARDKVCQKCHDINCRPLDAHHVRPRSRFPTMKYDVTNGKAIGRKCHIWIHDNPRAAHDAGLLYISKYV